MNKSGFSISIPQMIAGIVAMFITILGVRIVYPIIDVFFNLTWQNAFVKTGTTIAVYLIIAFLVYIIVYGYLTGKKPNILNLKKQEDNE